MSEKRSKTGKGGGWRRETKRTEKEGGEWGGMMGERVVRDDRERRTGTGGEERPERGEETERGPAMGRGHQRAERGREQ